MKTTSKRLLAIIMIIAVAISAFAVSANAVTPANTELTAISNTVAGVKISWKTASGASKYNVYRKVASSDPWKKIGESSSTSYTDSTASSGVVYYYTARGISGSNQGAYDKSGLSIRYMKAPVMSSSNATNGINVKWDKCTGAKQYYVYKKTEGADYKKIATVSADKLSYLDTTVKNDSGVKYIYTARAVASDGTMSSYKGCTLIRLANPTVTLANASAGMNVKWNKITGAKGYYVYRKTGSADYKKIATVNSGDTLSYQDTAVKTNNGTKYTYTVRAFNGSMNSSYAGKTNMRLVTGTISSLTNDAVSKATVKFAKNDLASGYQVQYSKSSTFASGVTSKNTTSTSFTVTGLEKFSKYYFRVRAYKTSGDTTYYSGWTGTKNTTIASSGSASHNYEVDKGSVTAKIGNVVRAWKLDQNGVNVEIHRVAYGSKITQFFTSAHGDAVDYKKNVTYQPYINVAIVTTSPEKLGIVSAKKLLGKTFGYTEEMAKKVGAIIAVNGEATEYKTNHSTIRNGVIEKESSTEPKKYHKYLLIHKDGTWDYGVPTKDNSKQYIKNGVYNTVRWQYELITNGVKTTRDLDKEEYSGYYHNRTVIGQISKNKYILAVSEFMPIKDVIKVMQAYGVKDGHLIAGGNCSSMYVKGIGNVTGGTGKQIRDMNKVNYLESEFFANNGLLGNGSNGYQKMGGPCEQEVDIIYFK